MARPFSAGWLVAAVAVITALGCAGFLVPLKPCRSCDGLALELIGRTGGTLPPARLPHLDCPDCHDRGKVSLFRSWMRPQVSESVAEVLRSLKDLTKGDTLRSLTALIQSDGKNPSAFPLGFANRIAFNVIPRFIEAEGDPCLVLMISYPMGGGSAVTFLLFSPQGRAKDWVQLMCPSGKVPLYGRILEEMAADGAWITISPAAILRSSMSYNCPPIDYQLDQWERLTDSGVIEWGPTSADKVCRIALRAGRFEVLTPARK